MTEAPFLGYLGANGFVAHRQYFDRANLVGRGVFDVVVETS